MCENEIEVKCKKRGCEVTNYYKDIKTENNPEYFECGKCGGIITAYIKNGKYSGLCNYVGPLSKTAVGVINADGEKLFVTANGRQYTRNEFKEVFKRDPMDDIIKKVELGKVFKYINTVEANAGR
jgi:hypothetical protein